MSKKSETFKRDLISNLLEIRTAITQAASNYPVKPKIQFSSASGLFRMIAHLE